MRSGPDAEAAFDHWSSHRSEVLTGASNAFLVAAAAFVALSLELLEQLDSQVIVWGMALLLVSAMAGIYANIHKAQEARITASISRREYSRVRIAAGEKPLRR